MYFSLQHAFVKSVKFHFQVEKIIVTSKIL